MAVFVVPANLAAAAQSDPSPARRQWVIMLPTIVAALRRRWSLALGEVLLSARGATADLDTVDTAVLAVARGESTRLPDARPPVLGIPGCDCGYGWILGQFALLGRTVTVGLLIDRGADLHDNAFDTDGPTPLDCAVWGLRNNRADDGDYPGTVQALLQAGALTRYAGPTGDDVIDALLAAHRKDT